MPASIIRAWDYTWQDIWQPLRDHEAAPQDLFMELYPELCRAFAGSDLNMDRFYSAASDPALAEKQFMEVRSNSFLSERALIRFFAEARSVIDDFGVPELTELYEHLLGTFFERYNLRFRVERPFEITVAPGALFCSLVDEVSKQIGPDRHLDGLNGSLRRQFDLLARDGRSHEVNRCIAQASTFIEGIAGSMPGMKPGSLTDLIKEMDGTWPHVLVRDALSRLYNFCSDYPNIRHAGNPASQLRELELRDAVIIPMVFMAFSGYFVDVDFSELLCVRAADVPIPLQAPANVVAVEPL